jgi:Dehydrogenases with different specificities (related to short-chain alcohol dehydrogenases)
MNVTQQTNPYDFRGKVAAVTGGSRGLGKACSKLLMEYGCRDMAVLCASGTGEVDGPIYIKTRVDAKQDVIHAMNLIRQNFGRLDILINCAGVSSLTSFLEITETEYDSVLDINLKGTFLCCQEAMKLMLENHYGRIVNVASTAGITGGSVGPQYGASKAGVIALTQSIGRAFAPQGILTNCVAPGEMKTDMLYELFDKEEMREKRTDGIPVKRFAEPEEIASMVIYLASDLCSYMTGETVRLSGGRI